MTPPDEADPLFERHPHNPILTAADWPYPVNSVFNPGAVRLPDGRTLLLCRVEDRRGISHLTAARSPDGVGHWEIDPRPTFLPDPDRHPEERWGVEDPRLTFVSELDQYAVAYTAYSRGGPAVSLALTRDFRAFDRLGAVLPPEDKDTALFPRPFDGRWAMIPPVDGLLGRAHLDLLLAGPAALGGPPSGDRGAPGRLVGRGEDRSISAPD